MRDLDTFGSLVKHRTARATAFTMIVFLSAIVSSIAMTIVPTSAQALNQWKCTGKPDFSPEEQITGCSGAIRSGKLVGKDLAAAFTIRGSAYRVHGDLKRSVEDYNQAAKLDPKNADIFYRRGIALGMSGEADRAIGDFDQAIKLEPDHVGALYSRGLTYSNTGRWERASKTTIRLSSSARTT